MHEAFEVGISMLDLESRIATEDSCKLPFSIGRGSEEVLQLFFLCSNGISKSKLELIIGEKGDTRMIR
jgi:hypothetical protein